MRIPRKRSQWDWKAIGIHIVPNIIFSTIQKASLIETYASPPQVPRADTPSPQPPYGLGRSHATVGWRCKANSLQPRPLLRGSVEV